MTQPTGRPRPSTYDKHPEDVWQAVRRDFMDGMTIPRAAERHRVGLAAAYWRSRKHGWVEDRDDARLKAARLAAEGASTHTAVAPAAAQTPDAAARAAFAESARALAEGRPAEAQTWARLARQMSDLTLPGGEDDEDDPRADAGEDDPANRHRRFVPGQPTAFDQITAIAERRLDMLFRELWLGGRWDERLGRPAYCIDRDGRIVETWKVEDAWFAGQSPPRDRMDAALPPAASLTPPPLAWILEVWLPDWNARHPDTPSTPSEAMMIHRLYTRDPRLEWGYNSDRVMLAKCLWEEEQRRQDLPLPPPAPPAWADKTERDLAAWRARVKAMGWDV